MPRTDTVSTEVYKFDELTDEAKERAREWFRAGNLEGYDWWEFVFEDAANIAELFGLDIRQRRVTLQNGDTRFAESIYFRGFSSQGDGACFDGTYAYKAGARKAVRSYAPLDTELHAIVNALQAAQRPVFYQAQARIKQDGRYSHEYSMGVDVDTDGDANVSDENHNTAADAITEALRDFARWIYKRLEEEYEFLNSDEQVDESIRTNEYEFTEDGSIY